MRPRFRGVIGSKRALVWTRLYDRPAVGGRVTHSPRHHLQLTPHSFLKIAPDTELYLFFGSQHRQHQLLSQLTQLFDAWKSVAPGIDRPHYLRSEKYGGTCFFISTVLVPEGLVHPL